MIQSEQPEFEQFLADIREPGGLSISAERFATTLELPLSRLAELAGVEADMLGSPSDSPQIQRYMEAAVQVLAAGTELAGGDCLVELADRIVRESGDSENFDAAAWVADWLDVPHPALGGKSPRDFLDTEDGFTRLSKLLLQQQSSTYV